MSLNVNDGGPVGNQGLPDDFFQRITPKKEDISQALIGEGVQPAIAKGGIDASSKATFGALNGRVDKNGQPLKTGDIFGKVTEKANLEEIKATRVDVTKDMNSIERFGLRRKHMRLFGIAAQYENAKLPATKARREKEMLELLSKLSPEERNAALSMRAPNGETLLMTLTRDPANTALAEKVLDFADPAVKNLAIDQPNLDGETLLYRAATYGNTTLVTKLLMLGADPHIKTAAKTPAEVARGEDLQKLLGSFKKQSNQHDTAVEIARIYGEALSLQVERYVVRASMAETDPTQIPERDKALEDIMKLIAEHKDNFPESREFATAFFGQLNESGLPPLAYCLTEGQDDLARLLLQSGAPPTFLNDLIEYGADDKMNPESGQQMMMKALKFAHDNGQIPNALNVKDGEGNTPLMNVISNTAISQGTQRAFVGHFVSQGANLNSKNQDGSTALHFGHALGDQELIDLLGQAGAAATKNNYGLTPEEVGQRRVRGWEFAGQMMTRLGDSEELREKLKNFIPLYMKGAVDEEELEDIQDSENSLSDILQDLSNLTTEINEEEATARAQKEIDTLLRDLKNVFPNLSDEYIRDLRNAYLANRLTLEDVEEQARPVEELEGYVHAGDIRKLNEIVRAQRASQGADISDLIFTKIGLDTEKGIKVAIFLNAYKEGKISEKEIRKAIEDGTIEDMVRKEVEATKGERAEKAKDYSKEIIAKMNDNLSPIEKKALKALLQGYIDGYVFEADIPWALVSAANEELDQKHIRDLLFKRDEPVTDDEYKDEMGLYE